MNRDSGDENGEVKVNPGEGRQTETNCEKIKSFHDKNIVGADLLSYPCSTTNDEIKNPNAVVCAVLSAFEYSTRAPFSAEHSGRYSASLYRVIPSSFDIGH